MALGWCRQAEQRAWLVGQREGKVLITRTARSVHHLHPRRLLMLSYVVAKRVQQDMSQFLPVDHRDHPHI
jgi:hypothetical protein